MITVYDPRRERPRMDAHAERCIMWLNPYEQARRRNGGKLGSAMVYDFDAPHHVVGLEYEDPEDLNTYRHAESVGRSCPNCMRSLSRSFTKGFWWCRSCGYEWRSPTYMACVRCGKELTPQQQFSRLQTARKAKRLFKPHPRGPFCSRQCKGGR